MATITLEFNMAGSVFQDLGLGTLTPNMDDQIGVGMEREVAGQTMSIECQVFVKIFAFLLFSNYWVTSHYLSLGGGGRGGRIFGNHVVFMGERKGDHSSPTEYKGVI